MDHQQKKDRTERVTGLGRKMRQERGKRNQMTALRFQTGGKQSDIPGLPCVWGGGGVQFWTCDNRTLYHFSQLSHGDSCDLHMTTDQTYTDEQMHQNTWRNQTQFN